MAKLSSNSHMLKHLVMNHEGADFSEVMLSMKVVCFARSAFEMQLQEAVRIEQEKESNHLLKGSLDKKKPEIVWSFTKLGGAGGTPLPNYFRFFPVEKFYCLKMIYML